MPGLAAIVAEPGKPGLAEALERMLAALCYPNYTTSRVILPDLGVALGRTGPSRVVHGPQPGYAAGQDIIALVEGEVVGAPALIARLGLAPDTPPAALVAALYERGGQRGLEDLRQGHWAVAIADRRLRRVVFANDPMGMRPLYHTCAQDGTLLIATHPAALLAYPNASREVDPVGLADYLAFGHVLGSKTLFKGIELLPGATMLVWAEGKLAARRYWVPNAPLAKPVTEADLEAFCCAFNEVVAEMISVGEPVSMALSGGGDSRAVLSAMMAAGLRPDTVTHSVAGATDEEISSQVARQAGVSHHFYEVRGEDLIEQILPGVYLLGGQAAGIDVHPLCFLDDFPRFTRAMFTGLGGNLYKSSEWVWADGGRSGALPGLADWILSLYNLVIPAKTGLPALISPDFCVDVADVPLRSVTEVLEAMGPDTPARQRSVLFYLQERTRKSLTKGDAVVRREIETRHPFMNPDLFVQAQGLLPAMRDKGIVESYIITRNASDLADIRFTFSLRDGFPLRRYPSSRLGRMTTQMSQVWQLLLEQAGQGPRHVSSYRYAEWIRDSLKSLFVDVLLDQRTLARPYFRPETIRRWLDEHMAGHDHTAKLSALLSFELTVRSLLEANAH